MIVGQLTDFISTDTDGVRERETECLIHTRTHTQTTHGEGDEVDNVRYVASGTITTYAVSDRRARVENPTCTKVGRSARD